MLTLSYHHYLRAAGDTYKGGINDVPLFDMFRYQKVGHRLCLPESSRLCLVPVAAMPAAAADIPSPKAQLLGCPAQAQLPSKHSFKSPESRSIMRSVAGPAAQEWACPVQVTAADIDSWDDLQAAGHFMTLLVGWCHIWRAFLPLQRAQESPSARAEARMAAKQGQNQDKAVWCVLTSSSLQPALP